MKQTLYFYGYHGNEQVRCGADTHVISEIRIPQDQRFYPPFTIDFTDANKLLRIGEVADIVVGDMGLLKKATRLGIRENPPPHIPQEETAQNTYDPYDPNEFKQVFRWKKKRVWIVENFSCLLRHKVGSK